MDGEYSRTHSNRSSFDNSGEWKEEAAGQINEHLSSVLNAELSKERNNPHSSAVEGGRTEISTSTSSVAKAPTRKWLQLPTTLDRIVEEECETSTAPDSTTVTKQTVSAPCFVPLRSVVDSPQGNYIPFSYSYIVQYRIVGMQYW